MKFLFSWLRASFHWKLVIDSKYHEVRYGVEGKRFMCYLPTLKACMDFIQFCKEEPAKNSTVTKIEARHICLEKEI